MQSPATAEKLDRVFHALADATRRRILVELARGDQPVMHLVRRFEISQPAVTKHLNVLEAAGLIARRRDGRRRRCRLRAAELSRPLEWVERCRRLWNDRFDELEMLLAEPAGEEKR